MMYKDYSNSIRVVQKCTCHANMVKIISIDIPIILMIILIVTANKQLHMDMVWLSLDGQKKVCTCSLQFNFIFDHKVISRTL